VVTGDEDSLNPNAMDQMYRIGPSHQPGIPRRLNVMPGVPQHSQQVQ
jgi:hypothetical protein